MWRHEHAQSFRMDFVLARITTVPPGMGANVSRSFGLKATNCRMFRDF